MPDSAKSAVGSIDSLDLKELLDSIRFRYGYDFTDYSQASLKRRVEHYMSTHAVTHFKEFAQALLKDESLFENFVQELSVTVTEMFRDPLFYLALREKVIPRLATYPHIKVWIAGCATGEEVYSTAILLQEEGLLNRSIIYATDINQQSLQKAKAGIYPIARMKSYTKNYLSAGGKGSLSEYYQAKFDSVLFNKNLRNNIVFSPHNLVADRSFNEFQLILCRNVLIYFNQSLQDHVLDLFCKSLCQFGFLGLGNKESLLFFGQRKKFDVVDAREKIYMKNC